MDETTKAQEQKPMSAEEHEAIIRRLRDWLDNVDKLCAALKAAKEWTQAQDEQ